MNFPPLDTTHKSAREPNRPRATGVANPERHPNKGSPRAGRSRAKPSPRSRADKRSQSASCTPTEQTPEHQAPAARRQATATISVPPASPEGTVGGALYSGILRNPPSPVSNPLPPPPPPPPPPTGGYRIPIPEGFASVLGMKPLCKCPLCPSSFTAQSLRAHMESIHFPWFLNPFKACWLCHGHVTNHADQNEYAAHGGQFPRDTHLDYWGYLLVWFLNQLSPELQAPDVSQLMTLVKQAYIILPSVGIDDSFSPLEAKVLHAMQTVFGISHWSILAALIGRLSLDAQVLMRGYHLARPSTSG